MERESEHAELIDLGVASEETLGGDGLPSDLVRNIENAGISDD